MSLLAVLEANGKSQCSLYISKQGFM